MPISSGANAWPTKYFRQANKAEEKKIIVKDRWAELIEEAQGNRGGKIVKTTVSESSPQGRFISTNVAAQQAVQNRYNITTNVDTPILLTQTVQPTRSSSPAPPRPSHPSHQTIVHQHNHHLIVTSRDTNSSTPPKLNEKPFIYSASSPCFGCCIASGKTASVGGYGTGGYAGGHGGCCGDGPDGYDWYTDNIHLRRRRCIACVLAILFLLLILALILGLIIGLTVSSEESQRTSLAQTYPGGYYVYDSLNQPQVYVYPVTSGADKAYLVYREDCNPTPSSGSQLPNCDEVSTRLVAYSNYTFPTTTPSSQNSGDCFVSVKSCNAIVSVFTTLVVIMAAL